ncbi:MarR family winged helix-turn-helix transcriptional regulator [Actinocorallia longicatena]|uniref:MarR family transcriptional regulator n=1 Tax=Actinocorallia longicatena TaxID=111803 RepID=A0ABP6QIX2_9ACTN
MDDSVDRHLARWKGYAPFDERTEGIVTRMQFLVRQLHQAKDRALVEVGLQQFEFETLHWLVAHGGRATPSQLAGELKISPAGITGRLDTLEKAGLLRRTRGERDRRRVDVEISDLGRELWTGAQRIRGEVEDGMVGALGVEERDALNALLKRMLLAVEE